MRDAKARRLAKKALKGLVTDAQKVVSAMGSPFTSFGNFPQRFSSQVTNTTAASNSLSDTYLDPGTLVYKGIGWLATSFSAYAGWKKTFSNVSLSKMGHSYDPANPVHLHAWFYMKTNNIGGTWPSNGIYIGTNKIPIITGSEVTVVDMGNGWNKYVIDHILTESDFQQDTFDRFEIAWYGASSSIETQELDICGLFAYVGEISLGSYFGSNAATILSNDLTALKARQRRWQGKKAYFCGDSITENRLYQAPLASKLELGSYTTDGNPGQAISGCASKIVATPTLLDGHDLLTIFAGTNDFGGNKALGDINSPVDTTTTYGSLKLAISTICTAKPNLKVVLITPLPRGQFDTQPAYGVANGQGKYLIDYVNAVREVGKYYHIPVLDWHDTIGWNQFNIASKTGDNLHPNTQGNDDMVPIMASFLEAL